LIVVGQTACFNIKWQTAAAAAAKAKAKDRRSGIVVEV